MQTGRSLPPKPPRKKTPGRIRPTMRKETINPADYVKYETRFSCEECTHFDPENEFCTIGYNPEHHRMAEQKHQYLLSGRIAFCRFHEID